MTSSPAPSTVSINGKAQGATPIGIRLRRRRESQIIRIESPGYFPYEIQVGRDATAPNIFKSAIMGAVAGGLVALAEKSWEPHRKLPTNLAIDVPAGAAIFVVIDLMPHEGETPRSRELLVTLTRAVGQPRVDIMRIDAEEFRNIKWIRVRGG